MQSGMLTVDSENAANGSGETQPKPKSPGNTPYDCKFGFSDEGPLHPKKASIWIANVKIQDK